VKGNSAFKQEHLPPLNTSSLHSVLSAVHSLQDGFRTGSWGTKIILLHHVPSMSHRTRWVSFPSVLLVGSFELKNCLPVPDNLFCVQCVGAHSLTYERLKCLTGKDVGTAGQRWRSSRNAKTARGRKYDPHTRNSQSIKTQF